MTITDEQIITSLRSVADDQGVPADLVARSQLGGRRRLRGRRRLVAVAASVGVAGVVATVVIAVQAISPSHGVQGATTSPDLYAAPPTGPDPCAQLSDNDGGAVAASTYPQLLMLPPGQPVTYAFTNSGGAPQCSYFPHVALTLLQSIQGTVTRSVEIDGPDAITEVQAGLQSPPDAPGSVTFSDAVQIGHFAIDGHRAFIDYVAAARTAQVYWPGAHGARWHAQITGLSLEQVKKLLNQINYDEIMGTASLPQAAKSGWTVAPAAPDFSGDRSGVFYALWHDHASRVALDVTPGPDRIEQITVRHSQLVTIGGRPGTLRQLGQSFEVLTWQPTANVTAHLTMTHSTADQIEQLANSISPVAPSDPRIHRP